MVNWEAKQRCRDLIIVPPQYDQYLKYSKLTQAIYQRYTDMVEPFGMDECWLDVTGSRYVCGDARTIAAAAFRSFKERYFWNTKVRAVAVRAIELSPKDSVEQLTLFDNVQHRIAMEKVQDAVEEIRGRFGKSAITYACLMGDLKMPTDGRDKVRMPGIMYQ